MRACRSCGVEKSLDEFYRSGAYHARVCKKCRIARQLVRDRTPEGRARARQSYRRRYYHRTYGVSQERFDEMKAAVGGVCPVCRVGTDLVLDHDHQTGRVRGVLCRPCNLGVGHFQDDPERIKAAAQYLMLHDLLDVLDGAPS